jgi:hypothetical protein
MSYPHYPAPAQVFSVPDLAGQIRDWQDRLDCVNIVGERLARFLQKAFPNALEEAAELGGAVSAYLGHGFQQQIDSLQAFKANPPQPFRDPYSTVESLAHFVKERDGLQSQLDQLEETARRFEKSGKDNTLAEMIRAQIVMLDIPRKLEEANERISSIQRELETA